MTALEILAGLALAVIVILAIRPIVRPLVRLGRFDPQLRKPHNWKGGDDEA